MTKINKSMSTSQNSNKKQTHSSQKVTKKEHDTNIKNKNTQI